MSSLMSIVIVVLMGLTLSMAYPYFYHRPPLNNYELERGPMNFYYSYPSPMTLFRSMSHFYQPFAQPQQWSALVNALNKQSKNTQELQPMLREPLDNDDGYNDKEDPIKGAYLVPANTNAAFTGPLAVVSGNQGNNEFGTNNAGSTATEYLPIIGGLNWPFIHPSINGRSSIGLQNYYDSSSNEPIFLYHPLMEHPSDNMLPYY